MEQETTAGVARLLRRLANVVEENQPVTLSLANEDVTVPGDAKIRIRYDRDNNAGELSIRVTWGLDATLSLLIHTRGDHVQDSFGQPV